MPVSFCSIDWLPIGQDRRQSEESPSIPCSDKLCPHLLRINSCRAAHGIMFKLLAHCSLQALGVENIVLVCRMVVSKSWQSLLGSGVKFPEPSSQARKTDNGFMAFIHVCRTSWSVWMSILHLSIWTQRCRLTCKTPLRQWPESLPIRRLWEKFISQRSSNDACCSQYRFGVLISPESCPFDPNLKVAGPPKTDHI